MIKISNKVINDQVFMGSLVELSKMRGFKTVEVAYNVSRILRQVMEALKVIRTDYAALVKPFLVVDEKGQFSYLEVPTPFCPFKMLEGKEDEVKFLVGEFLEKEVILESHPLTIHDLGCVDISPTQLISLEPIFAISPTEPLELKIVK